LGPEPIGLPLLPLLPLADFQTGRLAGSLAYCLDGWELDEIHGSWPGGGWLVVKLVGWMSSWLAGDLLGWLA